MPTTRKKNNPAVPRIFSGIFLAFLAILCVLMIIEGVFRLTRPPHGELQMGFVDSIHHHKLKAGQVFPNGFDTTARINNLGYRGEDFNVEKLPGVKRVLFLGDSFTYGSGVNDGETFSTLLGNYFKKHNFNIEVINGGFASYSPILHYLRTRDDHIHLMPDHVFLFYDLTDLQDDFNYEKNAVYDKKTGNLIGCNPMYVNGRLSLWKVFVAKSYFGRYIHNKAVRTFEKIEMLGFWEYLRLKLQGKRAKAAIVNLERSGNIKGDLLKYDRYIMIRDPSRLPLFVKHWQRSAHYLLLLRDFLAERNISFTLVLYPHGAQVSADQWRTGKVMWGFEQDKVYDDPYAWNHIKEWAGRENIDLIDLLPFFKSHGDEELYFDADVHMTPRGNQIFAEGLLAAEAFRKSLDLNRVANVAPAPFVQAPVGRLVRRHRAVGAAKAGAQSSGFPLTRE
ncbi:MAG: SGNH/GDSL hydrolase family protein [Candidatus Omnitrophica bacterium]|nr:SGNH/GDSL hydrolase family protein [Candidatus Omnitrophota bacterium]